jgi:hypothetical protein
VAVFDEHDAVIHSIYGYIEYIFNADLLFMIVRYALIPGLSMLNGGKFRRKEKRITFGLPIAVRLACYLFSDE